MEVQEQINKFYDFFEKKMHDELAEQMSKDNHFIVADFNELSKFDIELSELLLEEPEELIRAAEIAVEKFDFNKDTRNFKVRFRNLPESQNIKIRDIRSKHLGKLIQIEGIVRQKSDVRPQVTSALFECPSCGNKIRVLQISSKFREPTKCPCGRRGKFKLIDKELVDAQKIVVEEVPEELTGGEQPKRLDVFLKNDLVSPISEKKTNPGRKIVLVGYIKEIPIELRTGAKSIRFDLMMDANHTEPVAEEFSELELSKKDKEEILKLSKQENIYQLFVNSLAPSIYGHNKVKEALVLQMMGGIRKRREDSNVTRGDIHILLVGDPGAGKSQLLKRVSTIAPKSRYVSGKGASGAGMTASVVKDEFMRGYALEAGALVLTNGGVCCLDELDKMSTEDRSAMHEALEQQTVSISKANIQATLRAEAAVLAAANPKFGRFDPYEIIAKQIDLPSTLINRFDLIFPIRDLPDREKDEKLASFVLNLHKDKNANKGPIDTGLLKRYFAYARQNIIPELTEEALEEIRDYYVKMRSTTKTEEEGGAIHSVPISPRQLEALIRLSEASAKIFLRDKVLKEDARRAIELVHFCLSQVGIDPETGRIDIDKISTGITASQRSHISVIKEIINELENTIGKSIPVDDIIKEAKIKDVSEEKAEEIIQKLKRAGDIFSPKPGFISKV
ncbi:minichromosome maintenance protein MCM [Candidatus Woesearchaeota archaeon]|nr:minichromosome maintenance protein MCM [Candidatus Woesearchaeota archaeon]